MSTKRFRGLRLLVMIILALLVVQYEFDMAVNISDPPHLTPFSFSDMVKFNDALNQVGVPAQVHAGLGTLLVIIALVNLVLALRSKVRSVQIVGSLAFITVLLAAFLGEAFVTSGFQNDGYSHGMASNFILSFIFYFLELYFLKPAPVVQEN